MGNCSSQKYAHISRAAVVSNITQYSMWRKALTPSQYQVYDAAVMLHEHGTNAACQADTRSVLLARVPHRHIRRLCAAHIQLHVVHGQM